MDCPSCNSPNPPGSKICYKCHLPLDQPLQLEGKESLYPPRAKDRRRRAINKISGNVSRFVFSKSKWEYSPAKLILMYTVASAVPGGGHFLLKERRTGWLYLSIVAACVILGVILLHHGISNLLFLTAISFHLGGLISFIRTMRGLSSSDFYTPRNVIILFVAFNVIFVLLILAYYILPIPYRFIEIQYNVFPPYIQFNDRLILGRLNSESAANLQRGNWVVMDYRNMNLRRRWFNWIVPIVGLPGETIVITPESITINGTKINPADYNIPLIEASETMTVPQNHFLVFAAKDGSNLNYNQIDTEDGFARAAEYSKKNSMPLICPTASITERVIATIFPSDRRRLW